MSDLSNYASPQDTPIKDVEVVENKLVVTRQGGLKFERELLVGVGDCYTQTAGSTILPTGEEVPFEWPEGNFLTDLHFPGESISINDNDLTKFILDPSGLYVVYCAFMVMFSNKPVTFAVRDENFFYYHYEDKPVVSNGLMLPIVTAPFKLSPTANSLLISGTNGSGAAASATIQGRELRIVRVG